jgi:RNase P/RNase MRP subunit POP5
LVNPVLAEIVPSVSTSLGEAWACDVASALRAQTREVVGGWPGTLREARSRVMRALPAARQPTFDPATLAAWSRAVYDAARRYWDQIAEPDLEP